MNKMKHRYNKVCRYECKMVRGGVRCGRSSGDADAASTAAVETTLERLRGTRGALEELWADRERRLELTLQLRHFERDALEVRISIAPARGRIRLAYNRN